jgi:muconate cycloisomerase
MSENVIVRVKLKHGDRQTVGYGEGIPRDYVTGESPESALESLRCEFLPLFLNKEFAFDQELVEVLEMEFNQLKMQERSNGAAWCALELALLDAVGKATSKSLTTILGGRHIAHPDKGIRYGAVVPFGGRRTLLAILLFYRYYGFETVKLKVGKDLSTDISAVRLARKVLGEKVTLRVDANCAWSMEQALDAAEAMRPYNIASIEQPLPADDWKGLAELTKLIPEPIIADESLCTIHQAEMLSAQKIVTGFNIRISKVGGILAARRIARIAREHGLSIHLGAQVGESGILSAAARHFALSEAPCGNYEGSNNFFLLKQDLTDENLNVSYRGFGQQSLGGGLGVSVSPERLEKLKAIGTNRAIKPSHVQNEVRHSVI